MSTACPTPVPPPVAGKSSGRPKASEVEARTHELVQVAACLFIKQGYTKVSLEMIAREARVAVRTIYVKFGGKAGLLKAAIALRRERFFPDGSLEADTRPLREVLDGFARAFDTMLSSPDSISMMRVVMAESGSNPELAEAFYEAGPRLTRAMLARYFERPDIRAQLKDDLALDQLPGHLIATIHGDPVSRYLFPESQPGGEEARRLLAARMELFYRAILKQA